MRRRFVKLTGLLAVLAGVLAIAAPGRTEERSCGWAAVVAREEVVVPGPDEVARYWLLSLEIPPGGHLELDGRFPHARYLSFNSYNESTRAVDAIADFEIAPDAGSTNPFLPAANRNATHRDYTVRVVHGPPPAGAEQPGGPGEPNTVYTASPTSGAGIALRVYRPDRDRDRTGDVGLPVVTIVAADGQRTQLPQCPFPSPDVGDASTAVGEAGFGIPPDGPGLLGYDPPRWYRALTLLQIYARLMFDNEVTGDAAAPLITGIETATPSTTAGGENVHNSYMGASWSAEFGEVLVLRGRAPTTPDTFDGQARMGTGQLRYWSLCSIGHAINTYSCLNDDRIPVDRHGDYAIAISTKATRPANAQPSCGVAWMAAGPEPQAALFLRQMLPDAGFTQTIARAGVGQEEQVLGDYYPRGTYYATAEDFEALGCHAQGPKGGPTPPSTRPRLRLQLRRLRSGAIRTRVAGRDLRLVRTATFVLDARRVARQRGRTRIVSIGRRRLDRRAVHRLSARIVLRDGRHLTLRRRFRR